MALLKKYILFLCVTGFSISTSPMWAQHYNTDIVGKIKIDNHTDYLDITGTATNNAEINQSLRYELSVIKSSNGNNSKNAQNGRFTLEPSELKELSKTSINLESKDEIIILLLIYDLDDKLVGRDRYVINDKGIQQDNPKQVPSKEEVKEEKEPEDGIVLRGIVTEDTKTKAGSDFFTYFYSGYTSNKINSEKIVVINETFNFGRNTRIDVNVDGETVFRFFVQPKDDYLRSMADVSLKRVSRYLEQQKRNAASIQKY